MKCSPVPKNINTGGCNDIWINQLLIFFVFLTVALVFLLIVIAIIRLSNQ
jgi:hypothetical protein